MYFKYSDVWIEEGRIHFCREMRAWGRCFTAPALSFTGNFYSIHGWSSISKLGGSLGSLMNCAIHGHELHAQFTLFTELLKKVLGYTSHDLKESTIKDKKQKNLGKSGEGTNME